MKLFLEALAAQQAAGNRYASLGAWDDAKRQFFIKGDYHPRKNGLGKDLPTFLHQSAHRRRQDFTGYSDPWPRLSNHSEKPQRFRVGAVGGSQ
ncbi:MAG: hypothetical protein M5R38_04265 [Candidatus Methylomirabilis sp.]|nr:hypothetical protein [Candidatus Methylomirabilis sp.]